MSTEARTRKSTNEVSVTLRMPPPLLSAIDAFAADEFALRSHAIRTLVRRGLKASGRPPKRESP